MIACLGNIAWDTLARPVDEVRWGQSVWVETIAHRLGGNGGNTAFALARLGTLVRLTGWIGEDEAGDRTAGELSAAGVDTGGVARIPGATAATMVLIGSDGGRSFLHCPGVSREAFRWPAPPPLAPGVTHLHIANVYALPNLRPVAGEVLRAARAAGAATSLDTGWDARGEWMQVLAPCLPHLDLLFVNETEAQHLTGLGDAVEAARRLRASGPGCVVLKQAERGAAAFADREIALPGFAVEPVDTTGAGDSFCAGFLAARARGLGVEECLRVANAVGAMNVRVLGGCAGVGTWEETLAFASAAPQRT